MKVLKSKNSNEYLESNSIVITTFYKFCTIPNLELFRDKTKAFCQKYGILGTILLGQEGINSTIAGEKNAIEAFYAYIKTFECFVGMVFKESYFNKIPFGKLKVKIRKEIVSIHEECEYNPGQYIKPHDWDNFIHFMWQHGFGFEGYIDSPLKCHPHLKLSSESSMPDNILNSWNFYMVFKRNDNE